VRYSINLRRFVPERRSCAGNRLRHGLGAAHGIGHNQVITLVLPDGVPAEALIAGEAKAAAEGEAA
jgi:hypothetical protein